MSEDEMVDILLRMIPVAWKKDLLKSSDDPADSALTELEERLVRLEQSHDENQVSEKKGKKGKKSPKSDEDSSGKKGKRGQKHKSITDGTEKRKGKFCHYCDLIGGRSHTHNTKDCRKKSLIQGWADKNKKTNDKFGQNEINAMVEKALSKKAKRSRKAHESSSKSGSDSESD